MSLRSNSQGMGFLDSVIKARFVPVWCNLTRHKAQIMINELFTKAEPTPVALSHKFSPNVSALELLTSVCWKYCIIIYQRHLNFSSGHNDPSDNHVLYS